jgi:hypothetical protein
MLHVRWASHQELASQESANPDPESMAIKSSYRPPHRYSSPCFPGFLVINNAAWRNNIARLHSFLRFL